jgi:hypothetical protein
VLQSAEFNHRKSFPLPLVPAVVNTPVVKMQIVARGFSLGAGLPEGGVLLNADMQQASVTVGLSVDTHFRSSLSIRARQTIGTARIMPIAAAGQGDQKCKRDRSSAGPVGTYRLGCFGPWFQGTHEKNPKYDEILKLLRDAMAKGRVLKVQFASLDSDIVEGAQASR